MSRRRQLAKILRWERYIGRADALTVRQRRFNPSVVFCSDQPWTPFRVSPGAYRAYGWSIGARDVMRHGS